MKKITLFLFIFWSQLTLADINLYTTDNRAPHNLSEMGEILERFTLENPEKNIVVYVHGRNHYLEKEWRRIKAIELSYNVRVVMFRWDAWNSMLTRAVKGAGEAAAPLAMAFDEIRAFKESHPDFFIDRKITLLCHSMGNLVLKNFTENVLRNDDANFSSPIFDNYIGVGADVPLIGHRDWLSRFNLAKNKTILMNNRDAILLLSYGLDLIHKTPFTYRLGLGFDNYPGKKDQIKQKLVSDVTYVDLSDILKTEHGYFLPEKTIMGKIFKRLTNGQGFSVPDYEQQSQGVNLKIENNIYYVRKN